MAEAEPAKICPFCAETIKKAAKVCPFCRSPQVRFALWRQELSLGIPALMFIAAAIWVVDQAAPENRGRSFDGHGRDLIVLSTSLDREATKPDYFLSGIVSNRSEYPWRVHRLEVRFLDKHSSLLDVRHSSVENLFVVMPHQEHGFRVHLGELAFTNKGVTCQAAVRIATDGNRALKSD